MSEQVERLTPGEVLEKYRPRRHYFEDETLPFRELYDALEACQKEKKGLKMNDQVEPYLSPTALKEIAKIDNDEALVELANSWAHERKTLEFQRQELKAVLEVAIARGEKLGYMDEDYRERLAELKEPTDA